MIYLKIKLKKETIKIIYLKIKLKKKQKNI